MKKIYNLRLCAVELVKSFVGLTSKIDGSVVIISDRWTVDGKSIMGILSLDLTREILCEVEADDDQIATFEEGLRNLKLI